MRIPPHDECDLLRSIPALQLRLARQSLVHVIVRLPVQQTSDLILSRESFELVELMLEDPLVEIAAETDIERARKTPHDVDAIVAAISRHVVIVSSFNCGPP